MKRLKRKWLIVSISLALALVVTWAATGLRAGQDRLPVILISVSGLRYDRIMAAKPQNLPQLAAFHRQALLFTRAYTTSPNPPAAMTSLVTGLTVPEHGVWERGDQLLNRNVTLATAFRARQYPVAAFSGSGLPGSTNLLRDFSVSADGLGNGGAVNGNLFSWLDREQLTGPDRPFVAWLHYSDLLAPYDMDRRLARGDGNLAARADDAAWYGVTARRGRRHAAAEREKLNRSYDGAVRTLDYYLGRLFAGLRQRGYSPDNSLIVIAGLSGETLDDAGAEYWYTHNHQLRPEVVHIPLLWSSPQQRTGQCVVDPVTLTEVLPQLLRVSSGFDDNFAGYGEREREREIIVVDAVRATGKAQAAILHGGLLMARNTDGVVRAYPYGGGTVAAADSRHAEAVTRRYLKPLLDACPPLRAQAVRTEQLRSVGYLQ